MVSPHGSMKEHRQYLHPLFCNANSVGPAPQLQLGKSRGTTNGSNTIVANGDRLASIWIVGADGTDRNSSFAAFDFRVDGVPKKMIHREE